jgi:hypothetical protein
LIDPVTGVFTAATLDLQKTHAKSGRKRITLVREQADWQCLIGNCFLFFPLATGSGEKGYRSPLGSQIQTGKSWTGSSRLPQPADPARPLVTDASEWAQAGENALELREQPEP